MLSDPKKLRTPRGFGYLVSWLDRFRGLDAEGSRAFAQRLLDDPRNIEAVRTGLGRPEASVDELLEWLSTALAAGSTVAVRTRRKSRTMDAPQETDWRDMVTPDHGNDRVDTPETTWLELRIVDEVGEPIPDIPFRLASGERGTSDARGVVRFDDVASSFGRALVDGATTLVETLRERWSAHREAPWLEVEGRPHLTVSGPAEPLPEVALQAKTPHTLVLQPRVGRVRIVGMVFDTNKAFVLPDALGLLRDVADLYGDHTGSTMLVVGHTDTSGEPDLNLALSLDRARAVSAYLTDDVDAWLAFYGADVTASQRWGHAEDAILLERALWGQGHAPTGDSVAAYQEARGLTVDGDLGPETRRALVEDYMSLDGTTLPASITPVVHGCGESFPLADDGETLDVDPTDGVDDPTDRRVEVLFFDAPMGILPEPPSETSAPGDTSYKAWCRRAAYTRDMLVVRPLAVAVRVTDESTGEALPGAEVTLQGVDRLGAGSGGTTDVFGVRTFLNVVAGSYHVQANRDGYAQGSASVLIAPGDAASVVTEVAMGEEIAPDVHAHCAWSTSGPTGTVHCLAWITNDPEVPFPSATSMVRFASPPDTFVISEETPGTWTIETLSGDKLDAATTPSAQRLRYYDLPADWRSHGYWVRRAGEAPGDKRRFELRVSEQSSVASPFRVDLDDFVLGHLGLGNGFVDSVPRDGSVEHELAVLDSELQVFQPRGGRSWSLST